MALSLEMILPQLKKLNYPQNQPIKPGQYILV